MWSNMQHWCTNVDVIWCLTFGIFAGRVASEPVEDTDPSTFITEMVCFVFQKQTVEFLLYSRKFGWNVMDWWRWVIPTALTHQLNHMWCFGLLWQTTWVVNIVVFHSVIKCHWLCRLDMIFIHDIKVALDGRSRFETHTLTLLCDALRGLF